MHRVSVVIPCFNAAGHVAAAIDTALAQRVPDEIDVEIIAVDDASTDATRERLAALAADLPGTLRVVCLKRNRGPAAARNAGLRTAGGGFVCFLDADDYYRPGMFADCIAKFERSPRLAAVITEVELVGCDRPVAPLQHYAVFSSLPSNLMVRRAAALLIGGFPEDAAFRGRAASEDVEFRRALAEAFHFAILRRPYLCHVVRPGSHIHYFLDRTAVEDGQLVVREHSAEELSGALTAARARYREAVRRRLAAVPSGTLPLKAAAVSAT